MSPRDSLEFVLLAAIWGASFLFMRIAAPEFGPVPLMLVRCAIGVLTLLPILLMRGRLPQLQANLAPIALIGVLNSAIPFVLLGYASLTLNAGITSILNSLAPLWAALIGFLWLGERLTLAQVLGLFLGVAGVGVLVQAGQSPGVSDAGSWSDDGGLWVIMIPFMLAVVATAFYGLAANVSRRWLAGVDPLAIATGTQLSASIVLMGPGLLYWPERGAVGLDGWWSALTLGVLCTGVAYLLFFRLIGSVGATRTIAVTFVIPLFGLVWGWWFLNESITVNTLIGAGVVVMGTALATGFITPPHRKPG